MRPDLVRALRAALLDALAVVLPVECAGCGRADRSVCDSCRAQLAPDALERRTPGGLRVVAGLAYEAVPRRILLALKEDGRTDAASALVPALAAALRRLPEGELVPVPSSRAARRRRGFDPIREVLRVAGLRARPALRSRDAISQKSLGVEQRVANRLDTMRVTRAVTGRAVVLVDDVVTTGATLDEAARAIRAAGGEVVGAVAIASTPRYLGGS